MPSVGILTLELRLDGSHSLKDKRHTVKSLKDRLRGKFNVFRNDIDGFVLARLEAEKIAAEKAAEELEAERERAAISSAAEEGMAEGETVEVAADGEMTLSSAVQIAEDVADGRVRVPKLRRKLAEGKVRARKSGDNEDTP